jgi:hypothetical protein
MVEKRKRLRIFLADALASLVVGWAKKDVWRLSGFPTAHSY